MDSGNYFRLCHKCGCLNEIEEKQEDVTECLFCDYPMAPFCFFDEKYMPVMSAEKLRPALSTEDYNPINGLSVFWDHFEEPQ